jgi:sodium transport system permease protein
MTPVWWVIFKKELRETLRDRRTLMLMIVVPVLLYPAMLVVSEQLLLFGQRSLEADRSSVALVGDVPDDLTDILTANEDLDVVEIEGSPAEALRANTVAAVAVVGEPAGADGTREVTLLFDAASDRSQRARVELSDALDDWRDTLLAERLSQRGLARTFAVPVAVSDSSVALPTELGGYTLGRILPLLLVVITLLGAFYPAIDLAAGEKERGTLETLLTAPVPASAVVTGKFLTVALIGVIAAALNLGSMLLTFQTGMLQLTTLLEIEVSLPPGAVVAIFVTLIPLAVLFSALFLGLAVHASSFKEAQNTLTPVYMVVLVPAMLPLFPGIDFGPILAITPVAGVSFFFRDLMAGEPDWVLGVLVLASTALYAVAALAFAASAFGNERVLFGVAGEADVSRRSWLERLREVGGAGRVPEPAVALGFVAFLAVLFFYGGIRLQLALGERGLLAAEWLLLFVPAIAFLLIGRFDLGRTLSLRAPTARGLTAGVLLVAGGLPVVWLIGWLQTFVLPIPWEMLEGLEELVTARDLGRFVWLIVLLAVTPALCEEIVFRGVLLGGTRTLEPWRMIVLNGAVFGAFHLSFETVIRFLPTAMLGGLIAWAVWRTGSIWVGALMHFLNNGSIVVITSAPPLRDALADPDAPPPLWLVPVGVLLLSAGVRLLPKTDVARREAS